MAVDSVDAPQRRVLVVDDEATIVEFLTMGLTYEGWAVSAAMDGDAAIELARREQPDLIILDLMLPGVDGLAVCRGLRERSDVPIIMLTARGGLEERVVGLDGAPTTTSSSPSVSRSCPPASAPCSGGAALPFDEEERYARGFQHER